MEIKNIVEDIVIDSVEEVLKEFEDKHLKSNSFKIDLACFVLNKIRPLYISSNRGILHHEIDFDTNVQMQADIMSLIIKGIKILPERRKDESPESEEYKDDAEEPTLNYYYNFPHFMGRFILSENGTYITNSKITLYHILEDGKSLAKMINPKWKNPYYTSTQTEGYYTFWTAPIIDDKKSANQKTFNFRIVFEKDNIGTQEHNFTISIVSERKKNIKIRKGFIYRIPDILVNQ